MSQTPLNVIEKEIITQEKKEHLTKEEFSDLTVTQPGEVLFHLETFGNKGEMSIEQLIEDLGISEKFINKMLSDGLIFSHKAGWVKKL